MSLPTNSFLKLPVLLLGFVATTCSLWLLTGSSPYLALIPPLFLPLFLTFFAYPDWGYAYYFLVGLIPLSAWQELSQQYQSFTISKIIGILLALMIFVHIVIDPFTIRRFKSSLWYLLGFFLVLAIISSAYSKHVLVSLDNLRQFIMAYVFMGITLYFVNDKIFKKNLPLVMVGSISISSLAALIGKIFQIDDFVLTVSTGEITQRTVGASLDPNFFGSFIAVSLPMLSYLFVYARSTRLKTLYGFAFLMNSYVIITTYSRSAFLVFLLALSLILVEHRKKYTLKMVGFSVLIISLSGIYWVPQISSTPLWSRIKTIATPSADHSLSRRASYIRAAADAIAKHPLVGSGPGTFPYIYEKSGYAPAFASSSSDWKRAAHNTYLEIAVGMGIPGILTFLFILGCALRNYYTAQKNIRLIAPEKAAYLRSLACSFVILLAAFLFLSQVYHKYIWLFLGLSICSLRYSQNIISSPTTTIYPKEI